MPPSSKIKRENILAAAVELTRQSGAAALNARALAQYLGCSTQPIFSNYGSMEALKVEVIRYAGETYGRFVAEDVKSGKYPPYKASGMAYIRFAKEEKELFKMLFMRDRSNETIADEWDESAQMSISMMQKALGLPSEKVKQFHLEMWIYVHGIASLLATSYLPLEWDDISNMVTDAYEGMKKRYFS